MQKNPRALEEWIFQLLESVKQDVSIFVDEKRTTIYIMKLMVIEE